MRRDGGPVARSGNATGTSLVRWHAAHLGVRLPEGFHRSRTGHRVLRATYGCIRNTVCGTQSSISSSYLVVNSSSITGVFNMSFAHPFASDSTAHNSR